jgi:hypothetical protein
MRSWTPAAVYKPITRNVLFYDGPSQLTGDRILAIATAQNGNRKIGEMVQLWILPAISPIEAVRTGGDAAVCGDCKLRGDHGAERSCYVEYWRSVENIHQCRDKAARLSPEAFAALVAGLQLRIGAYGDPVAIPMAAWMPLLLTAGGYTAYSHAWRRREAQAYRSFCMASVDSLEEQDQAQALGWRTFRIRSSADDPLQPQELMCPASEEAGHKVTCDRCSLCRGQARPAKSIAIIVHGSKSRWFPVAVHRRADLALTT